MNNEKKNVFEEIVKTLTEDAMSLQKKFHKLQENNDIRASIDCLRLLKDTLSLIEEYDWELKYSEYQSDGQKEVSVWEQNHSGEIRNHKSWTIIDSATTTENKWYRMFTDYIISGRSCLIDNGSLHRRTGKSYALAKLCNEYKGLILYKNSFQVLGIETADKELGITNTFIPYIKGIANMRQYRGKILFIDEGSGLLPDEIDELKKNHIVIGFR